MMVGLFDSNECEVCEGVSCFILSQLLPCFALSGLKRAEHCGVLAGQSVVQIAEDIYTQQQYAVKFFLSQQAFEQEALLYEDPTQPLGRFLPECRAIADPTVGRGCTDKRGNLLPPCIVMEKGEALDKWAARSEEGLDFVTGLQVSCSIYCRFRVFIC